MNDETLRHMHEANDETLRHASLAEVCRGLQLLTKGAANQTQTADVAVSLRSALSVYYLCVLGNSNT
jgi:hypothetical protein